MRPYLKFKIPPVIPWIALGSIGLVHQPLYGIPSYLLTCSKVLAVMVLLVGICFLFAGIFALRKSKTTVNPLSPAAARTVVRTGIYRFSRNPIYLGMAFMLVAIAIWSLSLVGLLSAAVFCAYITLFQILPEELVLKEKFGGEFDSYMREVRRWL